MEPLKRVMIGAIAVAVVCGCATLFSKQAEQDLRQDVRELVDRLTPAPAPPVPDGPTPASPAPVAAPMDTETWYAIGGGSALVIGGLVTWWRRRSK